MKTGLMAFLMLFTFNIYATQNSLYLDGTNDFVQTTFPGISGTAARTVEAWVNTTANCDPGNGGGQQIITDWGSNVTGGRFTLCILWNNAIRLEVNGNGLSGSIAINDGLWHHVAAVYDPSAPNPVSLYVDGVLDVAGAITVPINTGSNVNMRIGKRIDDQKFMNGIIDEVRVWNTARSLSELQANMNSEICNVSSDLVAYYNFNVGVQGGNNTGLTTLPDLSANGNDGVLNFFALNGSTSNWINGAFLSLGASVTLDTQTACNSYVWPATGLTYTTSGMYPVSLMSASGCDSTVTLDLTINVANDQFTTLVECDTFVWADNGMTYTTSGVYSTTLTTPEGCSYTSTIDLTISNTDETLLTVSACDGYVWDITGLNYTNSGVYVATLTNNGGCDSIVTLDLTIGAIDNGITLNNDGSLSADGAGLQYQWIDCATNSAINGETNQSFNPMINGNYAVVVTNSFCSDTSDCITINNASLEELPRLNWIVYPNPNYGELTVHFDQFISDGKIEIFTLDGRLLKELQIEGNNDIKFNLTEFTGMVIIQLSTSGYRDVKKVTVY